MATAGLPSSDRARCTVTPTARQCRPKRIARCSGDSSQASNAERGVAIVCPAVEEVLAPDVERVSLRGLRRPARSTGVVREVAATRDDVRLRAGCVGKHLRPAERPQTRVPPRPVDEADQRALLKVGSRVNIVRRCTRRRRSEVSRPRRPRRRRGRRGRSRDDRGHRRCEQRGPHPGRKANVRRGCLQRQPTPACAKWPANAFDRRDLHWSRRRAIARRPPLAACAKCLSESHRSKRSSRVTGRRDTMSRRGRLPLPDHRPRLAAPLARGARGARAHPRRPLSPLLWSPG